MAAVVAAAMSMTLIMAGVTIDGVRGAGPGLSRKLDLAPSLHTRQSHTTATPSAPASASDYYTLLIIRTLSQEQLSLQFGLMASVIADGWSLVGEPPGLVLSPGVDTRRMLPPGTLTCQR